MYIMIIINNYQVLVSGLIMRIHYDRLIHNYQVLLQLIDKLDICCFGMK